ncbi:MAG TPA: hypothetical protein VK137_21200 [Planctomycetaceae bacterium]|nr:hypothetical protein [Planctomycetaceae bacterium]
MDNIPITFPSDRERFRRQIEDERDLTTDERLQVLCDMLATAAALNPSEDVFGSQDPLWLRREADWQRCMRELWQRQQQLAAGSDRS